MENLLSLLNDYTLNNADDVTKAMAEDFRKRRIENFEQITTIVFNFSASIRTR